MYNNSFTRKNPGLIVFLVEQSMFMEDIMPSNGFSLAVNASDAVNTMISEFILRMIEVDDDGREFIGRNTVIIIIGYGGKGDEAEVLFIGGIDEIYAKYSTQISPITKEEIWDVLQPVHGGGSPMASAFVCAKKRVEAWIGEYGNEYAPVPIIINITGGMPTDSIDDLKETTKRIMSLRIPDGNPLILNIQLSKEDCVLPIICPKDTSQCPDEYSKLLFEISSEVTNNLAYCLTDSLFFGERLFMCDANSDIGRWRGLRVFDGLVNGSRPWIRSRIIDNNNNFNIKKTNMYKNSFTRKNPGLFVFLVDQSGSMEDIMPSNGFSLAVNASEAVNTIIQESILRLTDTEEDGTEFVKQSLTVIIIGYGGKGTGYGNEWDYKAEVLCGETITEINSKYATKDSQIAHEEMRDVLQPVFGGGTPMASAFLTAKEAIESWVQAHNDEKDPVPVLINITDGRLNDIDNIDELKKAVNDIKSLAIPDGNPLVLNIHITKDAVEPVKYPKDESSCPDKYSKLLFEISSEVSKDLIDNNAEFAKNSFVGGERLFMSNVSDFNALIQFVRLGTPQKKLQ